MKNTNQQTTEALVILEKVGCFFNTSYREYAKIEAMILDANIDAALVLMDKFGCLKNLNNRELTKVIDTLKAI